MCAASLVKLESNLFHPTAADRCDVGVQMSLNYAYLRVLGTRPTLGQEKAFEN